LEDRDSKIILSGGQFRPEKNSFLQLEIMEKLRNEKGARLLIVGGVRNNEDQKLFNQLNLQKRENVELKANVPYLELRELYGKAAVGLHTIGNEHFGICVVEYIAAGLIPVAHNSAGPKEDTVQDQRFLAEEASEYTGKILMALKCDDEQRRSFRDQAKRCDTENFKKEFLRAIHIN
jgi:alpha-1,2-mannosyltransferase